LFSSVTAPALSRAARRRTCALPPAIGDPKQFSAIVAGGALLTAGMPRFQELTDEDLKHLRDYLMQRSSLLAH